MAAQRPIDRQALIVDLFDQHHRSMVRLACLLLDDPRLAEEIVQDAYVRLYDGKLDQLRDPASAYVYLRTAVVNLARSGLRRRVAARRYVAPSVGMAESPEVNLIVGEEQQRVVGALRRLPGRQRACVALRFYLDLADPEIAESLGISVGSVKTHLHRGLAALRISLGEER